MDKDKNKLAIVNCSTGWGGLEMNTLRLSEWLSETNEVTLICIKKSALAKAAAKSFVKVAYITKPAKFFPATAAYQLNGKLKSINTELVLFIYNKDLPLSVWIKVFSMGKVKMMYQQHMQLGISKRDIIHTIRYKMLDIWISPLHWLAEEVKQKTKIKQSKVKVIPLGIDVEILQSKAKNRVEARNFFGMKTNKPVFGILGRIDRKKNQHILLEAILKLKQKGLLVDVLIVGEPTINITDTYFDEIKQFIANNQLEEQVVIHPFINEIENFFGAIDYFVMATDKETYGMVTLESMAYGVPVLASNSGGSTEILGEGKLGTLFEPENSTDLAKKMEDILLNQAEVAKKSKEAKQTVETLYNYKYECEEFNKLMNSLVK